MKLFINSAGLYVEFYLIDNSKLFTIESKNCHTIKLYELIDIHNIDLQSISKVYVVTGPGSFTGLRVGVIFAKTLAQELNIPIYPVNHLKILFETNRQSIAIDAKGKQFFTYDGKEFKIKSEDIVKKEGYLLDPKIDYNKLEIYIDKYKEVNYLDVNIEYMKEVI